MREDMLWNDNDLAAAVSDDLPKAKNSKSNVTKVTMQELKARKMVGERALQKTRTLIHGCSHACASKAGLDSNAQAEHDRGNAGELYVRMTMTKKVSDFD